MTDDIEPPIHLSTGRSGNIWTTGCNLEFKSNEKPDNISSWASELTCPLCCTRLFVLHQRVPSMGDLMKLIDLDDPNVAKLFHFKGIRYRFRWLIDGVLIYIYEYEGSISPAQAIGLDYGMEKTYENAAERARRHVQRMIDMFDREYVDENYRGSTHPDVLAGKVQRSAAGTRTPAKSKHKPRQPVQRVEPTEPHCDTCWKLEEGDCVESPDDPTKLRCMPCYVKGFQK